MAGFGGVAEYGITVRWDKNFLKVVRLLLERRSEFQMFGGVRFGGTLSLEDAFELGFDHVALCAGAGQPTVLDLPNGLARGVRTASDFLMALQLTGAAKRDSVANLQIRLPVVVIGGGLTAIDTATESLAYYPVQVEKFLARYETLVAERGKAAVRAVWNAEENRDRRRIHRARACHPRRARSRALGRPRAAHRRAAAVLGRRDHRLPQAAHRQPVVHAESRGSRKGARRRHPLRRRFDAARGGGRRHSDTHRGCAFATQRADVTTGALEPTGEAVLPARTILVAAGTQPNTVLAREDAAHFQLDGNYFRRLRRER